MRSCQLTNRFIVPSAKAFGASTGSPNSGLRIVIDQARKELRISREILPAEVADLSFVNQAQKELGLR